ncbi:hypothetical protein RHD99_09010 [Buttiauxella selenatireducens]|uniref:Uncharacterized protein n=1 Tax=Buttiauxella selenatireducens TaxID=3073902 RepID=A0ABY9SFR2_9ENTR|nr:hypothetical protein [Buttiauxella sp. R73]WMY76055.1 hypothetical protein RHD99_09010 [Buttiauxella sp. R73]
MSTHTLWFWMCALLIPAGTGVVSYALRLRHYEQQWERVSYWNQLHQEKEAEMVALGQQALGLLGMAYVTPVASNKLASALMQGASSLQTSYLPGRTSILTMAQIQPPATLWNITEYTMRLETHLRSVLGMLGPELEQYATGEPVSVRIRHDRMLDDAQFLDLWQRVFPERYTTSQMMSGQQDDGLMWLDTWLDEQNSSLLLSLEVNLFGEGRDHQAESVSALLLASPAWLSRKKVAPANWIHRPVAVSMAKEALEDVVRWGSLSAEEKYFIWRTQLPVAPQTEMLQAMDATNFSFDKDREHQLDSSFGKPAAAVGHIALICACDHAICTQQPQWIMLQDKTPQWAIVRPA